MHTFIDNIITFSLRNKFFIFFCTTITVIAGITSFIHTPIDAFPDVTNTKVTIITQWPGRSAEEIEKFITIPIEIAMNPVQKKTDIRSTTLFGLSVINVMFEDKVDDFFARQQVYNLLNDADLPEGVTPEVQPLYGPTGEIFRYTLCSDKRSVRELKTLQDWVIERKLRAVPGVADIVSFGGEVKTFEVSVNPNQLISYGVTTLELYDAIAKSNINVGGDVITKSSQAYVVRGIGLINDVKEIENIVVKNINGTPILVKHLATVHESSLPRLGQVGRMEEDDVVQGIVVMRKGENPGEVITALKDKIKDIQQNALPEDVRIVSFYDRENLVDLAVKTVTHNLAEGILLVTFIVLIFMADWRTTVIVSIIIPLALLFAFICLRAMGMSANLLSMGAIDFGIIIDGAVVMVEGLFVALDRKAREVGMPAFNLMSKMGIIRHTAKDRAKVVFFSKLIIITALVPIFSFQKVEGKMFSPLAYTLGFALLGALIFTLTLVPVLSSMLLKKEVREKHNPFLAWINRKSIGIFDWCHARKKRTITFATLVAAVGIWSFTLLGSEFLPQLNEGSIYIRATLPQSISLDESVTLANQMRRKLAAYPEVRQVLSQTGRPNDGTDATGFYNIEFHVDIYPEKEWESERSKAGLIEKMQEDLAIYPGVDFNFSQPISDNVEEAASGVKGSIAVKVFGKDLYESEKKAVEVFKVLETVDGIEDLGVIWNIGQPELRIELNESRLARYGVAKEDVQSIIEMAIGGKSASLLYEDERKFNIMVRYESAFRRSENEIGKILVPAKDGSMIPIRELADIHTITGPLIIYRDNHARFCAVKFSVRGRDMGSAVAEAQRKVERQVKLPEGYTLKWTGDFENQQRATKRLAQVVPVSIAIIFVILFVLFGNARDAGLVLLNVPYAAVGGILALLITSFNFSISAGIGFIALFGICIQNGVIMISDIKNNLRERHPLEDSIKMSVKSRVRSVLMTASMAAIGLLPAALSHGIGSESQRPLAIVIIGGLIGATFFTLFVFPLMVEAFYRRMLYDKNGKLVQRRL
ncbi:efflux RND transporter permease subunit [Parabacteroides distasonis]|uniref:efflux RND transporter permease subunit n=1 Tax=Parabacteroides distasonis TaxID=823 RepID=UPI002166A87F|nr:CusA/CzcA family heavy metal efflux RND transporter [Parabacteroides distasonis]MCS2606707.1 CusA/CzcA family heavy metal efflux RND transporter [Parabacteroides distasonis]